MATTMGVGSGSFRNVTVKSGGSGKYSSSSGKSNVSSGSSSSGVASVNVGNKESWEQQTPMQKESTYSIGDVKVTRVAPGSQKYPVPTSLTAKAGGGSIKADGGVLTTSSGRIVGTYSTTPVYTKDTGVASSVSGGVVTYGGQVVGGQQTTTPTVTPERSFTSKPNFQLGTTVGSIGLQNVLATAQAGSKDFGTAMKAPKTISAPIIDLNNNIGGTITFASDVGISRARQIERSTPISFSKSDIPGLISPFSAPFVIAGKYSGVAQQQASLKSAGYGEQFKLASTPSSQLKYASLQGGYFLGSLGAGTVYSLENLKPAPFLTNLGTGGLWRGIETATSRASQSTSKVSRGIGFLGKTSLYAGGIYMGYSFFSDVGSQTKQLKTISSPVDRTNMFSDIVGGSLVSIGTFGLGYGTVASTVPKTAFETRVINPKSMEIITPERTTKYSLEGVRVGSPSIPDVQYRSALKNVFGKESASFIGGKSPTVIKYQEQFTGYRGWGKGGKISSELSIFKDTAILKQKFSGGSITTTQVGLDSSFSTKVARIGSGVPKSYVVSPLYTGGAPVFFGGKASYYSQQNIGDSQLYQFRTNVNRYTFTTNVGGKSLSGYYDSLGRTDVLSRAGTTKFYRDVQSFTAIGKLGEEGGTSVGVKFGNRRQSLFGVSETKLQVGSAKNVLNQYSIYSKSLSPKISSTFIVDKNVFSVGQLKTLYVRKGIVKSRGQRTLGGRGGIFDTVKDIPKLETYKPSKISNTKSSKLPEYIRIILDQGKPTEKVKWSYEEATGKHPSTIPITPMLNAGDIKRVQLQKELLNKYGYTTKGKPNTITYDTNVGSSVILEQPITKQRINLGNKIFDLDYKVERLKSESRLKSEQVNIPTTIGIGKTINIPRLIYRQNTRNILSTNQITLNKLDIIQTPDVRQITNQRTIQKVDTINKLEFVNVNRLITRINPITDIANTNFVPPVVPIPTDPFVFGSRKSLPFNVGNGVARSIYKGRNRLYEYTPSLTSIGLFGKSTRIYGAKGSGRLGEVTGLGVRPLYRGK